MRDKKVRGLKRKVRNMIRRIDEETNDFPLDFYNGYWHLHLPVAQGFIDSNKTPFGIKRLCVQHLLERAKHLIEIKPSSRDTYRVVVYSSIQALFDSQIIVFVGDTYFKDFFNRNDEFQKWIPLPKERSFESEWKINISQNMSILRFKEEITEDGDVYKRDIWFIGEVE